jgi:hypothetical protein
MSGMRKREIEKLLVRAVAEALGVESTPSPRKIVTAQAFRKARAEQQRAAA